MEATHLQSLCLLPCYHPQAGFFSATFSLLTSESPLVIVDTFFVSCLFPEIAISTSRKLGNDCLDVFRINPFPPSLMAWVLSPTPYFYFKKPFLPMQNSISQPWSNQWVRTNPVPNLQSLPVSCKHINHSTSDKEKNKFFCWKAVMGTHHVNKSRHLIDFLWLLSTLY